MATAGKTVGFKDKDYVDNEFIDILSAPDEEYLKGDGTWATAAEIIGVGLLLDTLGDVTLTSPADDDFLIYDTATSLWKNKASSTIPASIGLGSSDSVDFDNLTLTGNLVVGGTRTIINTEVLGVVDPIITLQTAADGGPLTVDSNKDVGLGLQYFDGSAKTAFIGFDDSELKLTFVPDATITNEVVTGAKGTIVADLEGTITAQGDTELYALSQVTSAANKGIQFTGSGTAATYDLTIAGKALLDDADAATQRLTLGLGSVATHSLSSVIAMTASQVPGYLQHLDPASVSILKSGLGTIATHSLSSVLGLLGEPRLPNYITPTTRSILKFGLGTIATHSLSSVLALTQQQIPQISTRTKLILKSGLGTAATHSLSSILGLIGEPRLPNYITPTTRNILKSGLGTIATHSLSSVIAMMSSTKSLSGMKDIDITGVYTDDIIVYDGTRWVNQKPPNAAGLRALGLGTIATHSLSSVLALLGEPRLPNYISPTTRNILKTGLGTIATHSLSSVVAMMSSTQSISGMKDIDITNATTNDIIVYDGIRWVNQTAPTARLSLGLGSVATHSLSNILAMASGSASASYDPATKNILKAGLGTIATHSLSSVLGLIGEPRLPNYISPTTERILRQGLGTIATKSFASVLSSFDHNTSLKGLQDTVIDSATLADNDFLIFNSADSKWYNRSTATSRTKMGVAIGTDVFAQPSATGSLPLPVGTTAQQAGSQGGIRYNTTTPGFEGYDGSAWGALGGAAGGASEINEVETGTVDLDGTYNETIMIADVFNVVGSVVLTADFYMSKISDDGTNVTLTGSGSITGSGTIGQAFPFFTGTAAEQRTQLGLGTIATHSLSTVLAMASGSAAKIDFVSKKSGGTFLGDIFATNLSGTNTGDQTLPTDFVSAANGGTFSDKVMISKVSAGFTADSHFKLENLGDVDQDRTGILWRTRSANGGKAWFGFEKMLNYGRGDFVWMLDNAQDDNTVTTTDEMLRLRHLTGSLEPGVDNSQDLGSGSKRWSTMYGNATSANWSDLAERYEADKYYDEGTVLAIGGAKEVTEFKRGMPFAGVVSIHPGLRMNDKPEYEDDPNFPYICLTGRIPVKINGTAIKGDYIVADDKGKARSIGKQPNINIMHASIKRDLTLHLIGIALETGEKKIEVKV